MTLNTALNQLANPDQQVYITFQFENDREEIIFANLKHALAQKALIAKYDFVSCWNNHFVAK